jgi:uncharacterized cupredoxin-like copper-binding protein
MRNTLLLSAILIATVVLAGCGSPAATQAPAPIASPTTAATPTTAAAAGTQVEVTLADNTIESSLTTFKAGETYTFVINNSGRHAHNFNISTPVEEAGSLDAALQSALLVVQQSQLPVGGSATVTYTFQASAVGTNLEFSCLIARHYEDGMRLPITVTQ